MGWQHEEYGAHEGGVIGYVVRDGCAPDRARALWRRHLELDVIAANPLRVDAAATRASSFAEASVHRRT